MKKRGRPTRLDARLARKICRLLREGITIRAALDALDVSQSRYFEWLQKDDHFREQTTRARANGKIALVRRILGDKDWRSIAWYLSRAHPAEFAKTADRALPPEVEEKRQVSIAVVLNTNGKSLEEIAHFPIRRNEEPQALPETETEPPMEHWYNPVTRKIERVEPIDNGAGED